MSRLFTTHYVKRRVMHRNAPTPNPNYPNTFIVEFKVNDDWTGSMDNDLFDGHLDWLLSHDLEYKLTAKLKESM